MRFQSLQLMKDAKKKIPKFKGETMEQEFWATHDSTEYLDWSKAERGPVLPKLRPTLRFR